MATVEERAAAGASWFDRELPEWVGIVDPETLNLSEPCGCVIGQVTKFVVERDSDALGIAYAEEVIEGDGTWTDAYSFWVDGFVPGHEGLSTANQRDLGFTHSMPQYREERHAWRKEFGTIDGEYRALTVAWRAEIARRLG